MGALHQPTGTLVSDAFTVTLLTFSALELRLDAHPAGPTRVTKLRKVQCTDAYQRAKPEATAVVSVGENTGMNVI